MKPKLSIIILSWNTKEILANCLNSIQQNKGKIPIEVIVVDNGSKDDSVDYLKSLKRKNLTNIFNKKNRGFSKGNNQGFKKARGEYLLLLNSDTIVEKNSLKILINYLDKHPKTAAGSPMLLNPDYSPQIDYYMKFPNLWQVIFYHNVLLRPILMNTPLKYKAFSKLGKDKPFAVDQLPGAAIMTRKEVIKKTKGLDPDYSFLFEDVDWCYRVKKMKLGQLEVIPSSRIIHFGGASWKQWLKGDRAGFYQQYFRSLLIFVKKHYPEQEKKFVKAIKNSLTVNAFVSLFSLKIKKFNQSLKTARKFS